ncbi:hypothetical protein D3C71_894010 [compost metagenome]
MAQRNDGARDCHVGGVAQHVVHEGLVHLEPVDVKALEVGQAGIPGAKVVDGQLHAQRFERGQLLLGRVGVVHEL